MKERIEKITEELKALQCKTEKEVEEARVRLLGKKGEITQLFDEFRTIAPELKREFGQKLNILKKDALARIEELREVNATGITMVIVTHERGIANLTRKIVHLKDGLIESIEENDPDKMDFTKEIK